jgi:uncharacterized membrane protein
VPARLYLDRKSYWWDEVATVQICSAPWSEFWQWLWHNEANMTFYYLLVRQWIHLGDSERTIRSLSVIFAVVSIALIYAVGIRAFESTKAGLIAALLLSVNTAHIAYAQEARSYALLVLLCLLSLLFFLRIPASNMGNAMAYIVVSVLAVYTHFFAVFFLGAQWCTLFWLPGNDPQWKRFVLPISIIVILIVPALYYMLFRNSGQISHTPATQFNHLIRLLYFLVADGGRYHKVLALLYLLSITVAVRRLVVRSRNNAGSLRDWNTAVMICSLVIPVIVTFVLSMWMPMFAMRYLLICLAPLVLLAAQGLAELPLEWIRVGVASCIVLFSIGALRWYYGHPKDDWRGLAAYVIEHAKPGDAVIGCPAGVDWPAQYYLSKRAVHTSPKLSFVTPESLESNVDRHRSSSQPLANQRFWVVTWGSTCDTTSFSRLTSGYERVDQKPFDGSLALALYSSEGK